MLWHTSDRSTNYPGRLAKRLLAIAAPVLTSTAIASAPAYGATFAASHSEFYFDNFSHSPTSSHTFAGTDTWTWAKPAGSVAAVGNAEAVFFHPPNYPAVAWNESSSLAFGEGHDYRGFAASEARVIGNFFIPEAEDFYFDFSGGLQLATSIENSPGEAAKAAADISFLLLDRSQPENQQLLDFVSLSAALETDLDTDFIGYQNSPTVTANFSSHTEFGGLQEFAGIGVEGSVKRSFNSPTHLSLVELKNTRVAVKAPEPSLTLGFMVLGLLGIRLKSQTTKENN
ncbi:hypothetical protein [Phormidium sp. CCY1219]|uniref:hypothetical protein n=1 Tax=Phormidium sp. CCY1219 TaxID=2886104 RepID=UPI002D1F46D0|nr:hypothetical protein [Phormidium sp. CCY1219]MEB3830511.1 hypothetical protein [Phormidium sp. CCY1219]